MQGATGIIRYKIHGQQIKKAVCKTSNAEFTRTVFPRMVLHGPFRHTKTRPVGQHRQVSVQITVDRNGLHHFPAVNFQAAVEIMQP